MFDFFKKLRKDDSDVESKIEVLYNPQDNMSMREMKSLIGISIIQYGVKFADNSDQLSILEFIKKHDLERHFTIIDNSNK